MSEVEAIVVDVARRLPKTGIGRVVYVKYHQHGGPKIDMFLRPCRCWLQAMDTRR
jgi:hypothetical protein